MIEAFIQGFFISLIATIPIGAVSAIAIARTIKEGYQEGFFTMLGSSVADLVAFFIILSGLSFSLTKNPDIRLIFSVIASLIIIFIGWHTIKTKFEPSREKKPNLDKEANNFVSGFFVTIFNPYQFITYSVFITSLNIHFFSRGLIRTFSFGAFLGSFVWAIVVPFLVVKLRENYTDKIKKVYPYIGSFILFLGVLLFVRALYIFLVN